MTELNILWSVMVLVAYTAVLRWVSYSKGFKAGYFQGRSDQKELREMMS